MAENLREPDSEKNVAENRRIEIRNECLRQEESCLYTATTFFLWLRQVRLQKQFFIVAPLILGGVAGVSVFKNLLPDWTIALLAFSASLLPALADALKIETSVDEISRSAAEYKILQGRFRMAANFGPTDSVEKAERILGELIDRMDILRSTPLTPPEKYFLEAQRKIHAGHYTHAIDERPSKPLPGEAAGRVD